MKEFKVFFHQEEVAEFTTFKDAVDYIDSQLKIDKTLKPREFNIYRKL